MRRSTFVRAGAGAMFAAALAPLSRAARARDVVEYTLTARDVPFSPVPNLRFDGRGFNGIIPGPVLRVVHGQRLRATFVNRSADAATIHWHGMILPNAMDGVEDVTQPAVREGASFVYEFTPDPPGTRWYHDHVSGGLERGLYGLFIVEDPNDEPADTEFALVFHDVPRLSTIDAAMAGTSHAPMVDPLNSPEMTAMKPNDRMGDEVAYAAHCVNGRSYPNTEPLQVKVGQRVRLRMLNANPTQTRYVRLAGHRLTVTHADGNPLARPLDVDAVRIGVAERYDAWFEVTQPGAWLLQGLSSDPLAFEQAVVVHTPGMENATPKASPQSLDGIEFFSYQHAGGSATATPLRGDREFSFVLGGGEYASSRWTINGAVWPHTPKILVRRGDTVIVHFKNTTGMDHPMHLHGHNFDIVAVDGTRLAHPLVKDTSLVRSNGGTMTWRFAATSPAGRWLLHCHNEIHMMDGMRTEVVYVDDAHSS